MKNIKTIALIAPSGNLRNIEEINKKISILEKKYKIKKYYNENVAQSYVSDTVENRIKYLENAFLDNEVDLVLSIRGGFGAIQIIDKINYDLIKDSQKYYIGSSDATILLMALSQKTKIKCFHGLMITNGFVENLEKNIQIIENNELNLNLTPIKSGQASGILWGGNLSSLVSLLSSEAFIPNEDIILFLEDLNEPLYKIEKMFFEIYRNQKLKSKIKGLIFGDFYFEKKEILPLLEKFSNMLNIPSYLTYDITHKPNNITIPYRKYLNL